MSLVTDIQELLEESGGAVFWAAQHIYDAANEAMIDVWAESRHDLGKVTLTLSANDDLVAIPLTTIMIPQYLVRANKQYFPTTLARLEQYSRNWRSESAGVPKWFVLWDAETWRVWPKPDGTYAFDMWGVKWPPAEIAAGTLDITAPTLIKQAVAHRAAAVLCADIRPDLSTQFSETAVDLLMKFKIQLRNRGGHHITRLRPGSKLDAAKAGIISIGREYA